MFCWPAGAFQISRFSFAAALTEDFQFCNSNVSQYKVRRTVLELAPLLEQQLTEGMSDTQIKALNGRWTLEI